MKRFQVLLVVPFVILLVFGMALGGTALSQPDSVQATIHIPLATTNCWPNTLPVGAIPGQPLAAFCAIDEQGPGTSRAGENSWFDAFDHGLSFADFTGLDYIIFEKVGFVHKTIHWRHAYHWMVDLASHSPYDPPRYVRGGALLRPDKSFHFEDGKLVVEAEVAAGIEAYGTDAWPELVISTGAQPNDTGSLYAYDMFPEAWTLGCRLQATRYPVCALKSDNGDIEAGTGSTRIWEMSAHQPVGSKNFGGSPFEGRGDYWRVCGESEPDTACRDRFRLELTETTLTLFVNGHKYFEQIDIPPLPSELLSGDLYVYFPSMVVSHPAEAVRFHWDRLAVNPSYPPSAPLGFKSPEPTPAQDR